MDQVVVDLGAEPVAVGAEVTVIGPGDHGEPTAGDWAAWCETNEHEIYTGIGARVPRRYVDSSHVVDAVGSNDCRHAPTACTEHGRSGPSRGEHR